jgi:cytochrome c-type biogenesis protein CcmH/NrfF
MIKASWSSALRRIAAAFVICAATISSAGVLLTTRAQDDRAHQVGKKVKCMCGGCNDSAGTCFHVGGAFSGPCDKAKAMLKKIDQQIAQGDSDDLIVQSFVQEYGQVVLTEPPHSGFGSVAWAMPVLYLVVGTILVVLVILRWCKREAPAMRLATVAGAAAAISPEALESARRRVAQETED